MKVQAKGQSLLCFCPPEVCALLLSRWAWSPDWDSAFDLWGQLKEEHPVPIAKPPSALQRKACIPPLLLSEQRLRVGRTPHYESFPPEADLRVTSYHYYHSSFEAERSMFLLLTETEKQAGKHNCCTTNDVYQRFSDITHYLHFWETTRLSF